MTRLTSTLKWAPLAMVLALFAGLSLFSAACGAPFNAATSSSRATSTSTQGAGGEFLYVSNMNDGYVSAFKRNLTTGQPKFINKFSAGSSGGPMGIAIPPNNLYLYAANSKDGAIEQFSIGSDGGLAEIGAGPASDGSGAGTETVAINPADTYLFAADTNAGTITTWPINPNTGVLISPPTTNAIGGMRAPFGLAVNNAGAILYVSDPGSGQIFALAINNSTGALSNISGSPVLSQGAFAGDPSLLALNSVNNYMVGGDLTSPVIALYTFTAGGLPVFAANTPLTTGTDPYGIAWATIAGNPYAIAALQNSGSLPNGSVASFLQQSTGSLTATSVVTGVNGPTGLVVDSQNANAYSANFGNGTLTWYQLNVQCPTTGMTEVICAANTFNTEGTGKPGKGPWGIALTH